MDSPRSSKEATRFSTPVSDLDDHRRQPSTRPRGETVGSPQIPESPNAGRHAFSNVSNTTRSEFLQVNDELRQGGPHSRDFEQAIVDDDKSGAGEQPAERRPSHCPTLPKRATTRKGHNPINLTRSRDSSTSSRSSSPANSVDAFAHHRRRERGNTIETKAPSDLDLCLHRSTSGGTHARSRRPTFNNGSVRDLSLQDDRTSLRAAEDDVCFPVLDEPTRTLRIDFDELDEFVTESAKAKKHPPRQRYSFSSHGHGPKLFSDLRTQGLPTITRGSTNSLKAELDRAATDSGSIIDEKDGATEKDADLLTNIGPHMREVGRFSFFSTELEQTVIAPDFAELFKPGETSRDLFMLPEDGIWWLDILDPTEEELQVFGKAFGIHKLTTEDIQTQESREKVELFPKYYFVCFRSFFQVDPDHEDYMEPVNVYMVVFGEGILTMSYKPSPHAANVRKRIGKLRDYMSLTADWICYATIDDIVDTFGPPIHKIEQEADTIEDNVFTARDDDYVHLLRQIGACRKSVMSLMRLLGGKADVIKGFAKRCNESYSMTPRVEIGMYLGDVQDHVVTMMSNLGHFEKMLSRSHANYLAQLSADNIAQGNRVNETLSKITVLASILVPLNLICGLFGMNVPVPGRGSDGLGWFFGILGVIGFIVILFLGLARRFRFI
ncbi:Mg(2+) transporter [Puttea exsequens]|nr:Mg(2+) transporter [Puttea exsequens]